MIEVAALASQPAGSGDARRVARETRSRREPLRSKPAETPAAEEANRAETHPPEPTTTSRQTSRPTEKPPAEKPGRDEKPARRETGRRKRAAEEKPAEDGPPTDPGAMIGGTRVELTFPQEISHDPLREMIQAELDKATSSATRASGCVNADVRIGQ